MPHNYTYSKRAESDIKKIYRDTVQEWGISQADKYDAGLEKTVNLLAELPDIGRPCEEISEGYRRHEYERHVIFYRKRAADILIIRILHDRMDAQRHV